MSSKLGTVLLGLGLAGSVIGAALWWTAPGRARFYTDDGSIRAATVEAPLRDVMWREPELLGDSFSTDADEADPASDGTGNTVYFSRPGPGGDADLFVVERVGGGWGEARRLSINSLDHESGPAVSPDGEWLYFSSDRPGSIGGLDIWRAPLIDGLLGEPEALGPSVNTIDDEISPAVGVGAGGRTLYFSSNRPGGGVGASDEIEDTGFDLYLIGLGDSDAVAERMDLLSSNADDLSPAVSPAGDFVYFSSDRDGGAGGFDIYRARIRDGELGIPSHLGTDINSEADELEPSLSMEGFELLFASNRGGGQTDIFRAVSREVYLAHGSGRGVLADLLALVPWILAALAIVLLLALLRRLVADVSWQGRLATLGLMARCVLLSMVVHAGVMVAFTMMQVRPEEGVLAARDGSVRISLASSGVRASVASQLRGSTGPSDLARALTESPAASSDAVPMEALNVVSYRPADSQRITDRLAAEGSAQAAMPRRTKAEMPMETPPIDDADSERVASAVRTPAVETASRVSEASTSIEAADMSGVPASNPVVAGSSVPASQRFEPSRASKREKADAIEIEMALVDRSAAGAHGPRPSALPEAMSDESAHADTVEVSLPTNSTVGHAETERVLEVVRSGGVAALGSVDLHIGDSLGSPSKRFDIKHQKNTAARFQDSITGPSGQISLAGSGFQSNGTAEIETPDVFGAGELLVALPGSGADARGDVEPSDGSDENQSDGLAYADGSESPESTSDIRLGDLAGALSIETDVLVSNPGADTNDRIPLENSESGHRGLAGSAPIVTDLPDSIAFEDPTFAMPTLAPDPRLRGRVIDATTGEPIEGAIVRLDLERADDAEIRTDGSGRFELRFGDIPDNAALTASCPGYTPTAVNIAEADLDDGASIEILLRPFDPNVIAFEQDPVVHHLGNDEYSGRINSQFQRESEGVRLRMAFEFPADRLALGLAVAEIRLLTKGSQLENQVILNGRQIGVLAESPSDGSFGEQAIRVPLELLAAGANTVEFRSIRRAGTDIDDFEFVNVRLVMSVKKRGVF